MSAVQFQAVDLAAYLLQKPNRASGEVINTLKLNALLYFAEACSLALFERPLLSEGLEAWDHGPIYPSLWQALSSRGWNNLAADELKDAKTLDEATRDLLDDVYQAYGGFSLIELQNQIKQSAPWKEARRGLKDWDLDKRPLSKDSMAIHYRTVFAADEPVAHAAPGRALKQNY